MTPRIPLKLSRASTSSSANDANADNEFITILGFGSLLSEKSSRLTFPQLENFRLGRVSNYRRVFGHPTSLFFQRGIANLETLEMSSLSAEYAENHTGFVCSVFEVSNKDMMEDGVPSHAFLEREEEFNIATVPYYEDDGTESKGILCTASTDQEYLKRWGMERFDNHFSQYGISTIWGWKHDSGLRPCAVYLRHCILAAKSIGCYDDFLDETFLVDRKTNLREYLKENSHVMKAKPPPELASRYSG